MYKICICRLMTILCVFLVICSCAVNRKIEDRQVFLEKMRQTQDHLYTLAVYTQNYSYGLPHHPMVDWASRTPEKRKFVYDWYAGELGGAMTPEIKKIFDAQWNTHLDALKSFAYWTKDSENVEHRWREMGKIILTETPMLDPFGPSGKDAWLMGYWNAGYYWQYGRFCWISVGPDGKPDIYPFVQRRDGEYLDRDGKVISDPDLILKLGNEAVGKNYSYWDAGNRNYSKNPEDIDPNLIYDPTNGIMSSGDIIVQLGKDSKSMEGGSNYMFESATWVEPVKWGDLAWFIEKKDLSHIFNQSASATK